MVYFDNAATTYPKPAGVLRSVVSAITEYGGNPGRGGHDMAMRVSERIYSVRKKAGAFFNCPAENVIFTPNCTAALNMAIKGILRAGDHVILSCLEHNSVLRPIDRLSRDNIVSYDIAEFREEDEDAVLGAFERLINRHTRAIVCTHASNVTGRVMPIRRLGALCRKHGLLFLADAAQTAGVLPIDMERDGIDLLSMPGHKGLYGIAGSGMLLVGKGVDASRLDTLTEGGTGSLSAQLEQPDFLPDRLESGTVSAPAVFSIGAGLDFINQTGMERIYRHELRLCRMVWNAFQANPAVQLYGGSCELGRSAPIVAFNWKEIPSEELTGLLNREGFALRGGLHCSPLAHRHYGTLETGMARFAPSAFTREEEVVKFIRTMVRFGKNFPASLELRGEN